MSARLAAILVVLLAVLGGTAVVYQRQESTGLPADTAALGKPVLPGLKAADVARIRIVDPRETLTLDRKEQGWVIAEREGFPADLGKVRDFVLKMIELKIGQSEPIGEKDRARLNLDPQGAQPGTDVEFASVDGKQVAKLTIGKKYFKREVENADKAPADGRFVQRPDTPGTVYIVADPLAQASAKSADWIDRASFKVEKVKSLEVRFPDGGAWRIERSGDNADWKLAGAKPGDKLDTGRANAASYSLSLLELDDVAAKDVKDTGLEKPTVINATTLDGASYAIKVGRPMGEDYYVTFTSTRDDAREKRLSGYTLLIPKSKLEDTLKPRAELLEKTPEAKKK